MVRTGKKSEQTSNDMIPKREFIAGSHIYWRLSVRYGIDRRNEDLE